MGQFNNGISCVCSQSIPWRHGTGQAMVGFSFGWQESPLEGVLVVLTPLIQRWWARTGYNDIHVHGPP